MKKLFKWIISLVALLIVVAICLFCYVWFTEWKPQSQEIIYNSEVQERFSLPDTMTIVSWNIGYAGLGDDMDFFYDGGKTARTSKERTQQNLKAIVEFLKSQANADFILLQEVDLNSKRSYNVNQLNAIKDALVGYEAFFAYNYNSTYVPIPFSDPMGRVEAGLVTLSKHNVAKAIRYSFPSGFAFPMRLFNLKRGMLTIELVQSNGDTVWVNNIHNTAYDSGGMRDQEIKFLNDFLNLKQYTVTAGDWNSNPPGYTASRAELEDKYFSPIAVKTTDFDSSMVFAAETTVKTARYGYEPYVKGHTTETNIDFALLGNGYSIVDVEVVDLGYKNSDHNPVIYRITTKK